LFQRDWATIQGNSVLMVGLSLGLEERDLDQIADGVRGVPLSLGIRYLQRPGYGLRGRYLLP